MKRFTILLLMIFAIVALLASCGQSKNNNNVTIDQASTKVANVYKANCISCHALDLSGKMGDATNLQQVYTRLSEEEIATKIMTGGKTMPSFEERLTEDEIKGLAAWLAKQE